MSVTLANLRTYARDWLATNSTRLSDSSLNQAINIAMREIYRNRDLRFGELSTSAVAVTSTSFVITPPTGFSRPVMLWYETADNPDAITVMNEISFELWRERYQNNATTGDPVDFAMFGTQYIWIGPTPDRSFGLNMNYYGIPVDLSADGDHNDLTDSGWEALLFSALAYASLYMLEDERAATMFGSLAKKHLDALVAEHNRARFASKQFPQMQEPG